MAPKKPCFGFQMGRCTNGDQCDFAHVRDPTFKRKPCHHFQLGRCNKGDTCTFAHVKDADFVRPVCHHHQKGRCNKGAACNFSHDLDAAAAQASGSADGQAEAGKLSTEAAFRDWRYLIPREPENARKLGAHMSKFCKQASELVGSGDAGVVQEVIELLAGEGGMTRITELLDRPFESLTEAQFARVFDAQLQPFFTAISSENVRSSAILEGRLTTICNYIFGSGGERAQLLFHAITSHLCTLDLLTPDGDVDVSVGSAFEHSLAVLALTVKKNIAAQADEGLLSIVETLGALLDQATTDETIYSLGNINKHLNHLQRRFGLGKSLPTTNGKPTAKTGSNATFELAKEAPGLLSHEGPRHNNDHDDIRTISILPTVEEVQSARSEYLPPADPRDWHVGGLEGLLDRQFRLLREDTIGQLRDAAKFELERLQDPRRHAGNQLKRQGARTFVYSNLTIEDIAFDVHDGLEFALGFDQPAHLADKTEHKRRDWWEGSKRLGSEALICLLSSEGSVTFFIAAPECSPAYVKDAQLKATRGELHKRFNLYSNSERAYVIARLVSRDDTRGVIDQLLGNSTAVFSLVEFPGVILPSFFPTLQAMQRLSTSLDVPFAEIIAPTSTPDNPDRDVDIKLPAYATKPGFKFDLSSLTTDGTTIKLTPRQRMDKTAKELRKHSTLDTGQADALVSSLTRSFAMIQGPPGTGKSFSGVQIVKALLANKDAIDLGPVLSVTFTNHAQDQGLLRLVDGGVEQIVRIGGRSKAERLAQVNLRVIAQKQEMTKTEKADKFKLSQKAEQETKEINFLVSKLGHIGDEAQLENYLEMRNPDHHHQLFSGVDEDGFQTVNYHRGNVVAAWLRSGPYIHTRPRDLEELEDVHVNSMTSFERRTLHTDWMTELKEDLLDRLATALDSYREVKEKLDLIRTETDLRVLKQASIIGCTTSGLARNIDLLRRLNVKVLICEEAGEVLEAHLLTALLPSVEHCILIGDHQQLRPHVQNYELSAESRNGGHYALDVSLFERLVQPNNILAQPLPFSTLDVQRRMFPSISQLVRRTIYPNLKDAPSTHDHPTVAGVKERLFWLHHEHPETDGGDQQSTSHTNDFEVDMVAALLSHLIKQGVYASDDVAIITPYLGQLRKLRKKLSSSFEIVINERDQVDLVKEGVEGPEAEPLPEQAARNQVARGSLLSALRLATVDNFQGEEAKVIVVSLVRSNKKNTPGFLKTSNRINVLLSRAQHGMYIVGNSDTMQTVRMWAEVIQIFKDDGLLGTSLDLTCPRHPDDPLLVSKPDDFVRLAPEGGCSRMCEARLDCGHSCTSACHSDLLHDAVFCLEPCGRPKEGCDHVCPNRCGEVCPLSCFETVNGINITPPDCNHVKTSLPCHEFQDPAKIKCDVPLLRVVKGCGHEIEVPCWVDVEDPSFRCSAVCASPMDCGHQCRRRCSDCTQKGEDADGDVTVSVKHGRCKAPCGRAYTSCRHHDTSPCHGTEPCSPCEAHCENGCAHSRCTKRCNQPCAPCAEPECDIEFCKGSGCCSAPCVFVPQTRRCDKVLGCGCRCPGVAGERCPSVDFCQKCGTKENLDQMADYVGQENYADIDLDENPCIFTACSHVLTVETLDGWMDMQAHYEVDPATGDYLSIKKSAEPFSSNELKLCPACRGPLRDIARYGRIVRRANLDESAKKFTVWSGRKHLELAEKLAAEQDKLLNSIDGIRKPMQEVRIEGSADHQLTAVKRLRTAGRYKEVIILLHQVQQFADKLRKDEQPFQRVRDLVETTRRRNRQAGVQAFEFHSSELQLREHLQGISLLVRVETIILLDVLNVHSKTPESAEKGQLRVDFSDNRRRCEWMIQYAIDTVSVRQEGEGHSFWAKYAAMECGALNSAAQHVNENGEMTNRTEALKRAALAHLRAAEDVYERLPEGNGDLQDEIAEVKRMLDSGISASEMRMVVNAMMRELGFATGHWYRCANGHPFSIGECGMPMQQARCPACGAGIGGRSHRLAVGVQHADDIERDFAGMNLGR